MARKPLRIERAGVLTPRDRIWAAVRELGAGGGVFSLAEVMVLVGSLVPANQRRIAKVSSEETVLAAHIETVYYYLLGLSKAKPAYLKIVDAERPRAAPRRECITFELLRDVGIEAPTVSREGKETRPDQVITQLWTAMKVLGEFDPAELQAAASTPERSVSAGNARNYAAALCRAGFLEIARAPTNHIAARYRLLAAKYTGPRAPHLTHDDVVFDANTGRSWGRGGVLIHKGNT